METYSFSKIHHFYDCPLSFYHHYYLEDKTEETHGTSEFGSFVHNILEKYEKGELDLKDLSSYYEDNYEDNVKSNFVLFLGKNFSKDFAYDYYISGLNYFSEFEGFEDWKILEAEYEFTMVIENKFIFTGKIDLIAEDTDGNIIICDHKSKKKFNSKKERAEYAKQLYLYSLAVKEKYGKFPKKLIFNMFRDNKIEEIDFDIDEYEKTMQWLKDSVNEIEECMDFYANKDTFYCLNFCEYRNRKMKECD